MASSILKLSDVKLALKKEKINFKVQASKLNGTEEWITFIHRCNKTKVHGKIVRSFNEGEVRHWPSLNHENVAKLINILRICDNLCVYLTIHNEVTLKNIVHDETFMNDSKCFDRKRSYAKGIFSGLSYLHEKSLTVMNLCDNNIIISKADDRAIIFNLDHLTNQHKVAKSRLNIPEIYMAPETKKGEFHAKEAEIWTSGILMLDMFLSHLVPWAIVNFEPKNVIKVVDKISPELFQAANVGSVVSAMDLTLFQSFLKCFLKQNPLERLTTNYACTSSFLKSGDQYKIFRDSCERHPSPESMFPIEHCNQDLSDERSLNPTNDPYSNSISPREVANITSDFSIIKDQQTKKPFQTDKNILSVNQNFNDNHRNRFLETQKKDVIKSDIQMIRKEQLYLLKMSKIVNAHKNKEKINLEYYNQDLTERGCLNSISSNAISVRTQEREAVNVTSDVSVVKTQHTKTSFHCSENKTESIDSIRYFERPNKNKYENLPVKQSFNENIWNGISQTEDAKNDIKCDIERTRERHLNLKLREMVNSDKNGVKMELECKKVQEKSEKKQKKQRCVLKKHEEQKKPSFFFTCLGI